MKNRGPRVGQRVRFTVDGLSASPPEALWETTNNRYDAGEVGVLAFPHPDHKDCPGWWAVEVYSKVGKYRKLVVWAGPDMFEVI